MTVERFQPEHLREIDLQDSQRDAVKAFASQEYLDCISSNIGVTVRDSSGKAIGCGGVVDMDDGSLLWMFLTADARRNMVAVVRAAKRVIQVAKYPVYATAACDFGPGCRLLEMLGFTRQPETVFGVATDQKEHYVFARLA